MERLQAEQAEMLDHERTKREEWESVQVLHFLTSTTVEKDKLPKVHSQMSTTNNQSKNCRTRESRK